VKLAVIVWVMWPFWALYVLTRSEDELETIGVFVCVGLLILLLLGL